MKPIFSKTLFVPVFALSVVFSLSSCGKDHDLVSQYLVRDIGPKTQLGISKDHIKLGKAIVTETPLIDQNNIDKSPALSAK